MAQKWLSSSLLLLISMAMVALHQADATVPAIFIFGDSTADVGTNNFLYYSRAKANFPYYGIDYPGGRPTGRFSNGFTSADHIAKLLGFDKSPPPYLYLIKKGRSYYNKQIMKGVNFASAGAGILDSTGEILGEVVPLAKQLQQFAMVVSNITAQVGQEATDRFLSKSLIIISVGSNDIMEYFYRNREDPNPALTKVFMETLKNIYDYYLRMLIDLGVKKFGIINAPPVGCCPGQRIENPKGGCLEDLNKLTRTFNSKIAPLLHYLSSQFVGMKYSLGNADEMMTNILQNPIPYGFKEIKSACCGDGKLNGEEQCSLTSKVCLNRQEHLFWDLYHPTSAASRLAALTLYGGSLRFVAPINFKQLAEDDS